MRARCTSVNASLAAGSECGRSPVSRRDISLLLNWRVDMDVESAAVAIPTMMAAKKIFIGCVWGKNQEREMKTGHSFHAQQTNWKIFCFRFSKIKQKWSVPTTLFTTLWWKQILSKKKNKRSLWQHSNAHAQHTSLCQAVLSAKLGQTYTCMQGVIELPDPLYTPGWAVFPRKVFFV